MCVNSDDSVKYSYVALCARREFSAIYAQNATNP